MKVEDVRRLPPLDRFCHWIRERHNVYLRRRVGRPKPWTDDEVLRNYYFTNVYRELDKTTVWFREKVRDPLRHGELVILATVIFRWFNYIPTGELLLGEGLLVNWNSERALEVLGAVRAAKGQVFTGAYMINSPGGEKKLEAIVRRVSAVWDSRGAVVDFFRRMSGGGEPSLESAHTYLTQFEGMGGFMAYEVVTDLRYTVWLENATDVDTWCHIGPGARRGLYRLLGLDFPKGNNASGAPRLLKPAAEMGEMRKLLSRLRRRFPLMPRLEIREVEMCLCEFDKYERLLWRDGRSKRRYNGQAD